MSDVICSTNECPRSFECYRATAFPSKVQGYTDFFGPKHQQFECGYFIDIKEKEE